MLPSSHWKSVVHRIPSQIPVEHASSMVDGSPSLQGVPSVTGTSSQPLAGLQDESMHWVDGEQVGAVPATQAKLWQVSSPLHAFPSSQWASMVHSGTTPWQIPVEHASSMVDGLPSLQGVPSATGKSWQPLAGLQEESMHWVDGEQVGAVPATHAKFWQVSVPLHAFPSSQWASAVHSGTTPWQIPVEHASSIVPGLPSSQLLPSATGTLWQPLAGSQDESMHWVDGAQVGAVPATHAKFWQVSVPLHAFPSSQWKCAVHSGTTPWQVPREQVSSTVAGSPSSQGIPSATGTSWQPSAGSQTESRHWVDGGQVGAVPATHAKFWQVSEPLHVLPSSHWASMVHSGTTPVQPPAEHASSIVDGSPSSQGVPSASGTSWQPRAGSQDEFMHWVDGAQVGAVPATHAKFWQVSVPLHAFSSSQWACAVHSGTTPSQFPAEHASLTVEGLPSSQLLPSTTGAFVHIAPEQVSVVQRFPSSHALGSHTRAGITISFEYTDSFPASSYAVITT
jgi:hypothetical protein